MTPDMERLVEAAIKADDQDWTITRTDAANIVRAVLMELREMNRLSDDVMDAVGEAAADGASKSVNARMLAMAKRMRDGEPGLAPYEWLSPGFTAMVDAILAEPATA